MHRTLMASALLMAAATTLEAQSMQTGFLNRTVTVDGATRPYQVYVPADYDGSRAWPVILFLHGAGERGTDGPIQTQVGIASAIRNDHTRFPRSW